MTVFSLQARAEAATPSESERLYRAWRYAKAQWELAEHDPNKPEGLTAEEAEAFCGQEHAALTAFFLHPAEDPFDVSLKMRTFMDDESWQCTAASQIISQIAADVHALVLKCR